jgi:histone H3/H4
LESKRKTLTGKDVMDALEEMEFPQFIEPLKESLEGNNY